ncbi:26099_t:CDS:2, partial [Gigaspora rosea]
TDWNLEKLQEKEELIVNLKDGALNRGSIKKLEMSITMKTFWMKKKNNFKFAGKIKRKRRNNFKSRKDEYNDESQREEREEQPVIIRTFREQRLMEYIRNLESRLFDKTREVFNLEEQLREKDQIILNLEQRTLKLEKPKNVYLYSDLESISDQREQREEQPVIVRTFREQRLLEYIHNLEARLFERTRQVIHLEEQIRDRFS